MVNDKLLQTVKRTIDNKDLIKKGDTVLVCVSGGPDSAVLLHVLNALRKEYMMSLVVAHLDHMIRGRESADDAHFVQQLTHRLRLPCIVEKVDVQQTASLRKQSLEEAARDIRYDFYRWASEKSRATKVATGHTMDDQAETVLMRMIKGAGSLGLSGIPYKRRMGKLLVIRPLLDVKRSDIEGYLKAHSLPFRIDRSNLKTHYLRNKIRHLLIPQIEKEYNPKVKENLTSIAARLRDEYSYLDETAMHLYRRLATQKGNRIEIGIHALRSQHIALQRLIVRCIIQQLKGDLKRISYKHWQEVNALLLNKHKNAADLPEQLRVEKKKGHLIFTHARGERVQPQPAVEKPLRLRIPGQTHMHSLGVRFEASIVNGVPSFKKGAKRRVQYINADSLDLPLIIRTWQDGDRMRPLGMETTKKLHDIFVDEKVPKHIRDRIPLVISGSRILWVVGVKVAEECRVKKDTKKILKIAAVRS